MAITDGIKKVADKVFAPDPPGIPVHELKGIPGNVQRALDEAVANTGKKIWHGMVQSLGSGLGKGVFIMAAIIIGSAGLASLGGVGFAAGAATGLANLFTGMGPALLGIGGLLGAIMEIHQNQNKISAEIAKAQAAAFEALRTQSQPAKSPELTEPSFSAREMARRSAAQQQAVGK